MLRFILCEQRVPCRFAFGALFPRVPSGADLGRDLERRMAPAELHARRGDFVLAQRRAVRDFLALLVRRTETDDGLAADQGRLVRIDRGGNQRRLDCLGIVAVDVAQHFPTVGLEAFGRVVGEPAMHLAIDGNAVVVVNRNEFSELERAGKRGGFVRDALHQAAVAQEHVGVMIDDGEVRLVEARRQHLFRQRHADGVRQPLSERAGGGFDAGKFAMFRMSRRL